MVEITDRILAHVGIGEDDETMTEEHDVPISLDE